MKLWPRTAASEIERPVVCREPVEPARDQRGEGLGDGQCRQVADRPVHPVVDRQAALGDEHPDGLDGVERDPSGALEDRRHRRRGKSRARARQGARAWPPQSGVRGRAT